MQTQASTCCSSPAWVDQPCPADGPAAQSIMGLLELSNFCAQLATRLLLAIQRSPIVGLVPRSTPYVRTHTLYTSNLEGSHLRSSAYPVIQACEHDEDAGTGLDSHLVKPPGGSFVVSTREPHSARIRMPLVQHGRREGCRTPQSSKTVSVKHTCFPKDTSTPITGITRLIKCRAFTIDQDEGYPSKECNMMLLHLTSRRVQAMVSSHADICGCGLRRCGFCKLRGKPHLQYKKMLLINIIRDLALKAGALSHVCHDS